MGADKDDDPFGSYGLKPIELTHKGLFDGFFADCPARLSDYSFANTFIWGDSIHLRWRILRDHLCVFANGDGGLTLLFPPLGRGDFLVAVGEAMDVCGDYNTHVRFAGPARIEYVSGEILAAFGGDFTAEPMSGDYVYATRRMIDLDGGDLSSKRQVRNRFARRHAARTEPFGPRHADRCLELLHLWRAQHDEGPETGSPSVLIKRDKEEVATGEAIRHAGELGLSGMVLYADDELVGFTFGEMIGPDTCSILIEKTDRAYTGSAQYIFSEFCRQYWAHTTWCNVGDDWEVPSLAWTKESYRPAGRLPKWTVRPVRAIVLVRAPAAEGSDARAGQAPAAEDAPAVTVAAGPDAAPDAAPVLSPALVDRAGPGDLNELEALERQCFQRPLALGRRQLRYLLNSPRVSAHVIRRDGRIVAEAMILRRRTARGDVGRIYTLAVDAAQRHNGLGRTVLAGCLDVLAAEGAAAAVLEVDVANEHAIVLYEQMGFVRTRRLADYYAPGKDAWKMRLELLGAPERQAVMAVAGTPG